MNKCDALNGDSEIFKACYEKFPFQDNFMKRCKMDVCAHDTDSPAPICVIATHLAYRCMQKGVKVNWLAQSPFKEICAGDDYTLIVFDSII